jgi:cell division protease FtsH
MDEPNRRSILVPWLIGIALLYAMVLFLGRQAPAPEIPYSEFEAKLSTGQIAEVTVGRSTIEGVLREPLPDGETRFVTHRVDPELAAALQAQGTSYTGQPESGAYSGLLFWLLLTVLLFGFWIWLFRRMGRAMAGGATAFGKSKAKVFVQQDTGVTFADVAGVDEAKDELREVVGFLREPQSYSRLGAQVPKGILLVGPPGTGKTLLARAVAGEAGVPFFSINGSEFVELFVGVGAARVRDLFEQARLQSPCIVFIDELDALGRARGLAASGGGDEKEQTLNQLLAEMDGFSRGSRVILLAATNRPEILDPALLRAGRFDRQILVDRPDRLGRVQILRVHLRKVLPAAELDAEEIASLTPGFTGADLANLVNEATLAATRRGADAVTLDDFVVALERVIAGLAKKSRVLGAHERAVVAHHEMGHALVAEALVGLVDPVEKVSIIPRGIAGLGYTIQRPTEDRYLITRSELEARLAVLLAGRAAEQIVHGEFSTGAADDLEKATQLAREMVMRLGMDETVGQVVYGEPRSAHLAPVVGEGSDTRRYSEKTAREIESAVRRLVQCAFERAREILLRNRGALREGASLLLQRETLSRDELPRVVPAAAPAAGRAGEPIPA